ncbi:dienelactone hydrolase family protein [Actinokineospora bangkokensis]|uniref:Alpha/beta hydrolase n=1 Tax=Actinokineospora bangkokensis TaxID=1193682 RepID=A0A1Q9LEX4_9PSEU|nr:alpha/beta hydrolase [Actinokineospora bangkokensis]OLR90591.1 alpha/beta hydrolase [Actinokineospora bangkokensis]
MARKAKALLDELSRPGPHRVLRGDLALVGMPGVVCTPAAGLGLPAVAFGHGWLQPPHRYHGLLRHLASWGIVAAAPGTHVGPLGSHRLLAADLSTALDVCVGVRLGEGDISVDPGKLGLAGHSTGGGSAVLAAAADDRVKAVATLAAAQTRPFATEAATGCTAPSIHLAAGKDVVAPPVGHAEAIARAWAGPARVWTLPKAGHMGFTEGKHWSGLLVSGGSEGTTRRVARSLLTAFFLAELAGQRHYAALLDNPVKGAQLSYDSEAELAPSA